MDLCPRPRTDARALDVAVRRKSKKNEGIVVRRPRRHFQNQFFHRARALFFPAVCRDCRRGLRHRPFDLGLEKLPRFFPSARWRGVCVSRHADILHFENAANRHHIAGVFVFGGGHLYRQCVRFAIWNPAAHGEGWIIQRTRLAV